MARLMLLTALITIAAVASGYAEQNAAPQAPQPPQFPAILGADGPDQLLPGMPHNVPPMGLPGAGGPADAAAEGAEAKAEEKFVKVLLDADTITLTDGSEVKCTVIMVAERAAIVLTEEGEKLIPSDTIAKIERGYDKDLPVKLPVRSEDGFQFIVMEPIEGGAEGGGAQPAEPKVPAKTAVKVPPAAAKDTPRDVTAEALKKLDAAEMKKLLEKDAGISDLLKKARKQPDFKASKGKDEEEQFKAKKW